MIVSFCPILWPWSHNSYKWISIDKLLIGYIEFHIKTTNKFRINYIEEISIKSDTKRWKNIRNECAKPLPRNMKQRCISNLKIKHFYFYLCLSKGFELRYPIFMTKLNYNIQIKNQRMSYYLLAPLLKSLIFLLVISSDFRGSLSISINLSATSRFSI